uniref:Uncharacterized protein n=1 Tax=Trichogramma kaykai TaxID=54128 RepID=A0ABD2XFB7_9HYME
MLRSNNCNFKSKIISLSSVKWKAVKKQVKKELNNVNDDYIFDLMDSGKAKNFDTFPVYKSIANHRNENMMLQEKLDKKIFIDFDKPFKCNICHNSNGHKSILKRNIKGLHNRTHRRRKSVEEANSYELRSSRRRVSNYTRAPDEVQLTCSLRFCPRSILYKASIMLLFNFRGLYFEKSII